jgi:hypothetical protein
MFQVIFVLLDGWGVGAGVEDVAVDKVFGIWATGEAGFEGGGSWGSWGKGWGGVDGGFLSSLLLNVGHFGGVIEYSKLGGGVYGILDFLEIID